MFEKKIDAHRVITMLDRQEVDFLDTIGKDALFSTGHKLSHNEILKGLVDMAMEAHVNGDKVDSPETLKARIIEQIRHMVEDDLKKK